MNNRDNQRNLLIVNSRDKTTGSTSNFKYSLGDVSLDINSIALKQASIPHLHTNISENNNDLILEMGTQFNLSNTAELNYTINGITSSVPIPPGTYTLNSLITSLNNNNGGFGEWYCDPLTNRVDFRVISAGVNINGVDFLTGGAPAIMNILGFSLPVNCPTGVGSTITGTNAPTYVENNIFNIEIPTAQYTSSSLLTEVMTQLNLFFTSIATGTLVNDKVEIVNSTDTWKFRKSNIADILGYKVEEMIFQGTQTAQGVPDLFGTRYLYISSRVLSNGYNALQKGGDKTSILGCLPVCSTYGNIDKWEQEYLVKKDYPSPINVNNLDIQILDDQGGVVDLQGTDIVLIFECWCNTKL